MQLPGFCQINLPGENKEGVEANAIQASAPRVRSLRRPRPPGPRLPRRQEGSGRERRSPSGRRPCAPLSRAEGSGRPPPPFRLLPRQSGAPLAGASRTVQPYGRAPTERPAPAPGARPHPGVLGPLGPHRCPVFDRARGNGAL